MASPAVPKFDVKTIKPAGSPSPMPQQRNYTSEGNGFSLVFTLPFLRKDVYRELIAPKQLGVDHSNVEIQVTKRTQQAQADLEAQLTATARGRESDEIKKWQEEVLKNGLSVGCERTVKFPDGVVVSELVELVDEQLIRWRQLTSQRETNMIGSENGPLPETTIRLDELENDLGTSVHMTYDFWKILKSDNTEIPGELMSSLLKTATQGWAQDMASRGYSTCSGQAPNTGRPGYESGGTVDIGSSVLRSARRMQQDLEEEAAMKKAMLEKAAGGAA